MVSATSAPYAPTFCTGVAPAEPGMPERHSSPPSPCASDVTTTSSHAAPASARTMLPSTVISVLASRTTVRSVMSSASTTLDPPASTRASAAGGRGRGCTPTILRAGVAGDQPARDGSDAHVVSGASGTASETGRAADERLTTGGNGSVPAMPRSFDMATEYEGTVEQVHRAFREERYWLARLTESGAETPPLDRLSSARTAASTS